MAADPDQLAYVPVPVRNLAAMTAKLAQLMSYEDDGTATVAAAEPPEPPPELDEQLVRRIYEESELTHKQLLKHLAAQPDTWVSYAEPVRAVLATAARGSCRAR